MRTIVLLMLSACVVLLGHAEAGQKRDRWEAPQAASADIDIAGLSFTAQEQDLIRSYFRQHAYDHGSGEAAKQKGKSKKQKRLPPGLKKKLERGGELPPGWQKKLARGEVIDGELYAASQDLPEELDEGLGAGPLGTEIRLIEDEVFRLIEATGVIVDVLGL